LISGAVEFGWQGQRFGLLPQRAVYWREMSALLVADVHLGKAGAFRAAGVAVPEGVTGATLGRLSEAMRASGASRLIILGDLLHHRSGVDAGLLDALRAWREQHAALPIDLVLGNHDVCAGSLPPEIGITVHQDALELEGITLTHEPGEDAERPTIAGHVHPVVRLRGRGRQSVRGPAFVFGKHSALLPAFGAFTGGHVVTPNAEDAVFVVGPGEVAAVGRPAT
jgi:DNA ligase-associated metallophosphoesterase